MNKLIDFILCASIPLAELIGICIIALVVQAIMYQVFNINLYKIFSNIIFEIERRTQWIN